MAMNSLEANSMLEIPNHGDKQHENSTTTTTTTEQTLSFEAESKPKKTVHQFYLVKFRPYEDPDEASKILEAEQLIETLDRKYDQLLHQELLEFRIDQLNREKMSILSGLEGQKKMLDHLKLDLDKLNLAGKIPHKHKGGPHFTQGLKSCISHGSSNLVIERKLLKEMIRSQHRLNDIDLSSSSSSRVLSQFWCCSNWGNTNCEMLAKLAQIEETKNKALADYAENPIIFNPLIIRNAIEEQIQIVNKIALELKMEQREVGPAIKRLEKQLIPPPIKEEESIEVIRSMERLEEQRREIYKQRGAAQRCISKLRQTSVEMNSMYDEYVSVLSNARELARTKDIAALSKLSNHQVEGFMLEWNHPNLKTTRVNYEFNILNLLRNRGLGHDGRIKFKKG